MDYQELHEYLDYNKLTGILSWKKKLGSKCIVGQEVGYVSTDGYRYFGFKGKTLKSHRIIYFMVTKILPDYIDHDDRNRLNNKWGNLKASTMTQNNKNCNKQRNNKSGITGVSWSTERQKWVARISNNNKPIPLGRFVNLQDAIIARQKAEVKYGYHPNHGK